MDLEESALQTNEQTDEQIQNCTTLPQSGGPINGNMETEKGLP